MVCFITRNTGAARGMNPRRAWLPILYAVIAAGGGMIGGLLSDYARHLTWPMAAAAQSGNGQIISASEFDLVDQSGKVRAKLFLDGPYSPKLALYDFNDREGVSIAATVLGGEMILSSRHAPEQEKLQAKLSAFYDHAERS
jgi:hypothetical protein